MAEGEGVLGRWSRLKQEARLREPDVPEESGTPEAVANEPPLELPDIDSLDADSDFSPFLSGDVPEALQRLALRKLWRLDPVFANLDGLVDYGEDFTDAATVMEGMRTAYKVGKGFGEEVDPESSADEEVPEVDEESGVTSASNSDEVSVEAPEESEEDVVVSSGLSGENEPV